MAKESKNKECQVCGGSGQVSFFHGVSRFLLTVEECPECLGFGYELSDDDKRCKNPKSERQTGKKK